MTWLAWLTRPYWEGLRSEVAKLAEAVRAGRRTMLHMAAAGLAALAALGAPLALTLMRNKRKAAAVQAKRRVAV